MIEEKKYEQIVDIPDIVVIGGETESAQADEAVAAHARERGIVRPEPGTRSESPLSEGGFFEETIPAGERAGEKGSGIENGFLFEKDQSVRAYAGIQTRFLEKLPDDFKIDDIGKINLSEAEKIAKEGMSSLVDEKVISEFENIGPIPGEGKGADRAETSSVSAEPDGPPVELRDDLPEEEISLAPDEEHILAGAPAAGKTMVATGEARAPEEKPFVEADGRIETVFETPPEKIIPPRITSEPQAGMPDNGGGPVSADSPRADSESETHGEDLEILDVEIKKEDGAALPDAAQKDTILSHEGQFAEEIQDAEFTGQPVLFADDELVMKTVNDREAYAKDELEVLSSEITGIGEEDGIILKDTEVESETDLIAGIVPLMNDSAEEPAAGEPVRFRDDDLDFIHNEIIGGGGELPAKTVGAAAGTGKKIITPSVELLGLMGDEISDFENMFFHRKEVGETHNFFSDDRDDLQTKSVRPDAGIAGQKRQRLYLTPSADSLNAAEKESIEEDIGPGGAIIFEEDVREITNSLKAFLESNKNPPAENRVDDITDTIVILSNGMDIDSFIKSFPRTAGSDAGVHMKRHEAVPGGIPRSAEKNFSKQEYFNLYAKALTDQGA